MDGKYDKIINLPHHVSQIHPQMPMADRAAQFSPFAALTGYDDAVAETARLTEQQVELDENELEILSRRMQVIMNHLPQRPQVSITYFLPDERKLGGKYVTATGRIKKIDPIERIITMTDGTKIPIDASVKLESPLFSERSNDSEEPQ
jgi:hypothetical protein